jgi:hypothetical protein
MAVKLEPLLLAGCICLLAARPALARQDPTPPPSGIVIHLFGQGSVMSNVLPDVSAPGAPPRPATAPQSSGYVEPTMGDVLHQMFVTGDPNDPPKPSTGKFGDALAN